MKKTAHLHFLREPVDRVPADVVVVGFFREDRPLRGGAGRLDWRLCGQLSGMLSAGWLSGEFESAALLPGGGPIAACRVLLLGLGDRSEFTVRRAEEVTQDAVSRCLRLGAESIALAPIGIAPDDFARHSEAVIAGLSQALLGVEADSGLDLSKSLQVRMSLTEHQMRDAKATLPELVTRFDDPQIRIGADSQDGGLQQMSLRGPRPLDPSHPDLS